MKNTELLLGALQDDRSNYRQYSINLTVFIVPRLNDDCNMKSVSRKVKNADFSLKIC